MKERLYAASVCSTLTHGSEAWMLTPRAMAMLNGFNSRQLHRITGRSYREEATTPTKPSYDLLNAVRTRRHQWLGHILQMPTDRLVRRAMLALGQQTGPPYEPLDGHAPPPNRTNHASHRPLMMDTRQPIPLLPTGKHLRSETSIIVHLKLIKKLKIT